MLAAAGSAVGLGNIWRFPCEAGANGGAAFMLIYLCCIFLFAMPVMLGEFVIGRSSRANSVGSYRVLAPGKPWVITGFIGVLSGFLVLSYYSVVAGWTLGYTVRDIIKPFADEADATDLAARFTNFVSDPLLPSLCLITFILITHLVVSRGVEKGIERYSKLLMPMLLAILLVLAVFSLTMPGATQGLKFLFNPDFSKVDIYVIISAMGQAFFTLSVGISVLATYASYFSQQTRLIPSAFNVCIIDTIVAIVAGIIIFPAVFSVQGVEVTEGPGLVFIVLPYVFQNCFGSTPVLCWIVSVLFDALLLLAALTSSISMHEISTAYIHETYHVSRQRAAWTVTAVCISLGIVCSLSFGIWNAITVAGMTIFELFDYLVAKFFMPLGGILICTFVGWDMKHKLVREQLSLATDTIIHRLQTHTIFFLFRWLAPLGIGIIFVYELLK